MNPTKITQIVKKKVNTIERAMNEISGIELADNVLRSCCFATTSAGKCPQIRWTTDSVTQKVSLETLTGLSKIHKWQLVIIIIFQKLSLVKQSVNIILSEDWKQSSTLVSKSDYNQGSWVFRLKIRIFIKIKRRYFSGSSIMCPLKFSPLLMTVLAKILSRGAFEKQILWFSWKVLKQLWICYQVLVLFPETPWGFPSVLLLWCI